MRVSSRLVLPYLRSTAGATQLATRSAAEGRLPGERLADDELVHLSGSFVGQHRLEVVRVPQHRVLQRDSARAEDRAAAAGDLQRLADVVELAEAHLLRA